MRTLPLTLLLTLSLAACGDSDPKEAGYKAIQSGDWSGAAASFQKALDAAEPGSPDRVELAVARCQALAHTAPDQAKAEFLALAASAQLEPKDYTIVVSDLVSEKHFVPAIDILDVGVKTFPEHPKMTQLQQKVVEESQKADDPAALEKLKGLGYLGGK